jgi:hypothetical protein
MVKGKRTADGIQRQGRRAMPGLRTARRSARAAVPSFTLGDLVAAAYDAAGEARAVAQLLSSRELRRVLGRRIECV